jgi:hypothetical protein
LSVTTYPSLAWTHRSARHSSTAANVLTDAGAMASRSAQPPGLGRCYLSDHSARAGTLRGDSVDRPLTCDGQAPVVPRC